MTKRKTFRLSEQSRNSLKAELSKYKSGPPLGKIAKVYGVSLSTVNHHWGAIKRARKVKGKAKEALLPVAPAMPVKPIDHYAAVKSVHDYNPRIMGQLAQGTGTSLMTSSAAKSNGQHITVTIDQAWLKPIVEEVARTEVRDYLQTAFRK